MNKNKENLNNKVSISSQKELDINVNGNNSHGNIIEHNNKILNSDIEKIRKKIEEKVDFYMMKKYVDLFSSYNEKLSDLLAIQEKTFIKNEMIKQQIFHLEKYLKDLYKKNKIDYESISSQNI